KNFISSSISDENFLFSSKKINCPFLVNASCPKFNNPESQIRINKIINNHNHLLSVEQINFEENKKFSSEMLEDIKFLTSHCKFGAIVQRKFLEGKYPAQPIHSKDLYAAMQKFQPTSKLLSNDAALMSSWLDKQKEADSRWQLAVIITDADPAVDLAVRNVFSQSYPIYGAFHLTQNIHKHLRNSLGSDYSKFLEAFFLCQNSLAKETFEKRFEEIQQNFPSANSYMNVLYCNK
ncbi:8458_t:CDS:2, partial [Gigaspora rosea]